MSSENGEWIKDKTECWITPGGDPLWVCRECGGGQHVYGVESRPRYECPDCHRKMTYNYNMYLAHDGVHLIQNGD